MGSVCWVRVRVRIEFVMLESVLMTTKSRIFVLLLIGFFVISLCPFDFLIACSDDFILLAY